MGREPEALQTLEEARRGAVEREWYPFLWQIQSALGQQYSRLKREEQARSEFQAARMVIEDLAATIDDSELREIFLKEALGRLPQAGTKPDKVAQHSYPAGLTPREMEVLRLVAAGKSNRQVADELFLSERTVETHLTSILAKTHAENRAGATAFAYQQGLLDPASAPCDKPYDQERGWPVRPYGRLR